MGNQGRMGGSDDDAANCLALSKVSTVDLMKNHIFVFFIAFI